MNDITSNGVISSFKETVTKNYFNPNGRASRREYWFFLLGECAIILGLCILIGIFAALKIKILVAILMVVTILCSLALTLPAITLLIRRLHDINLTGWVALVLLIPGIGSVASIAFGVIAGTLGTNQYGPNPYGIEGITQVNNNNTSN